MGKINIKVMLCASVNVSGEIENPLEENIKKVRQTIIENIKQDFWRLYGLNVDTVGLDIEIYNEEDIRLNIYTGINTSQEINMVDKPLKITLEGDMQKEKYSIDNIKELHISSDIKTENIEDIFNKFLKTREMENAFSENSKNIIDNNK